MSDWLKIIAYVLITLFLGTLLKELGFKGSKLVLLLGVVSVIGATVTYIGKMFSFLPGLDEDTKKYSVAMLKILGVGYAFGICSDVCTDGLNSCEKQIVSFKYKMAFMGFVEAQRGG